MRFYIKEAREAAGYSQKELADILGVAHNTLHGYESGKHDPKSVLLAEIARICNVSVDYLLGISDYSYTTVISHDLDDSENELLQIFRELNEEGKHDLIKHGRIMIKSGDYSPTNGEVAAEKSDIAIG